MTDRKLTLCLGDVVERPLGKSRVQRGVVMALHPGADNRNRKRWAARVCMDSDAKGDLAYPFLFDELRKPPRAR